MSSQILFFPTLYEIVGNLRREIPSMVKSTYCIFHSDSLHYVLFSIDGILMLVQCFRIIKSSNISNIIKGYARFLVMFPKKRKKTPVFLFIYLFLFECLDNQRKMISVLYL